MDTTALLAERAKTHGSFEEQSRITRALKLVAQGRGGWNRLDHQQQEALDVIFLKIGRILAGNPNHDDHWADIAGYAELGRQAGTRQRHVTGSEEDPS